MSETARSATSKRFRMIHSVARFPADCRAPSQNAARCRRLSRAAADCRTLPLTVARCR